MFLVSPIALLFPLMNIFMVPKLRVTTFQVVICIYWRKKQNDQAKQTSADMGDRLSSEQMKAIKNMTKTAT
jgi:hypothetical protein